MRIAVCGMIQSENLGDKFISDSISRLISDVLKEHSQATTPVFVQTDITAVNDTLIDHSGGLDYMIKNHYGFNKDKTFWVRVFYRLKREIPKIGFKPVKNICYLVQHLIWRYGYNFRRRHLAYYETKFKNVDLILIVGGGLLEYSANEYQEPLNLITEYAQKHNIPVIVNAIGRAGEFDPSDYRCQVLMKAFQRDCVKYVSARDSIESVQACVGERFQVKLLADAAICLEEAYGITKDQNSSVIGIGLIRGTSLQSYNVNFTPDDWVDLFAGIGMELRNRGHAFQYFTNGLPSDYKTGLQVIEKLGLDQSYLVERPVDSRVLCRTISGYRGLITCRMHSSIAAFSMGIPSVILSWNKKVDKHMESIGYPHRAITKEQFDPAHIVDVLEDALKVGVSEENRNRMKAKARQSVTDYIAYLTK